MPAAVASGAKLEGTYDCSPSLTVGGRVFKNFESRGYGTIDLHTALVVSCDTVFYRLAYAAWQAQGGLAAPPGAKDPFVETARAFGIGRATGIDVPGESAGRIPDRAWKEQSGRRPGPRRASGPRVATPRSPGPTRPGPPT